MRWFFYRFFYRQIMRIAHRFNWHYAPPIYPEGDTQLWCQWCGFRQTVKRAAIASALQDKGTSRLPWSQLTRIT